MVGKRVKLYLSIFIIGFLVFNGVSYYYYLQTSNIHEKIPALTAKKVYIVSVNNGERGVFAGSMGAPEIEMQYYDFKTLARDRTVYVGVMGSEDVAAIISNGAIYYVPMSEIEGAVAPQYTDALFVTTSYTVENNTVYITVDKVWYGMPLFFGTLMWILIFVMICCYLEGRSMSTAPY